MKKILLTRGMVTMVDDEDFEQMNQWKWYCSASGYATRDVGGRKNKRHVWMHRLLNNTPEGLRTDHINQNKLDNRKINLRAVTGSQNGMNRGLNKNNTSGYKGVIWRNDIKKWRAMIKINYREVYLGCFKKIEEAVEARQRGEELLWKI